MTIWYVGPGGNDNNSGRTWETRLLTLNGAEDKPVVLGDTIYVGPGCYREALTVDINGASGSPITYIGDVTGEHTDGVGGIVRITGSDNDQTTARGNCITAAAGTASYRTWRGFYFDLSTSQAIIIGAAATCANWIIEDCVFALHADGIYVSGANHTDWIIRRCLFLNNSANAIQITHTVTMNADHLIENCVFIGNKEDSIIISRIGDITIKNCTFLGSRDDAIDVAFTVEAGHPVLVYNSIITGCAGGVEAAVLGDITENYNTFWGNSVNRTNVNVGANSVTYPALFNPPILNAGAELLSGFRFPWWAGELSQWSQISQRAGTGELNEDYYGIRRPHTHGGPIVSLCSWGAIQYQDRERSIIRSYDGDTSVLVREQAQGWMFVPGISATSHTISVRNWRTAGYGGHRNPAMIISQPGQADRMTVSGGAAGAWNQISDTFTPAADPPWLLVKLVNLCDFTTTTTTSTLSTTSTTSVSTTTQTVTTVTTTSTTLACDVWFDDLQVA